MSIRFDNRVAIVTGGAAGLGRAHAIGLAERGAHVVIADPGGADDVVAQIKAQGGTAEAHGIDISDEAAVRGLVADVIARLGRIDILVNNAGILRDKSFAKMPFDDFRKVLDVHLVGSALVTHAVWPHMRAAGYGRVVFTSSASGLYGNFGQANYGAAKAGMLGLMNVLHLEGARDDIRVNMLAPTATTAMTEDLLPEDAAQLLAPEAITPGLLWLVSEDAPSRTILCAGAGCFATTQITETDGICLSGDDLTPEAVAAHAARLTDPEGAVGLTQAFDQTKRFAQKAAKAAGADLNWS
ncbi:MAG: 3-oxoacyl-ACP reductase [Rhodobacterales bacterium]|nr:MAG: 3-oxoacyl-ACP reductase [Rhodobacterales bacterium]